MLGIVVFGSNACYTEDGTWYDLTPALLVRLGEVADGFAERTKVTKAIGSTLQNTAMKIITIVNQHKDHIPPITTSEANPFPYHIDLNPRVEGWGRSIGIF